MIGFLFCLALGGGVALLAGSTEIFAGVLIGSAVGLLITEAMGWS